MKKYQAGKELEALLLSNGLMCTSNEEELSRGKKTFKVNNNSKKYVRFDHIHTMVCMHVQQLEDFINMDEDDFRAVILFLKLDSAHLEELGIVDSFNSEKVKSRMEILKTGLEKIKKEGGQSKRQAKLSAILYQWNSIVV